MNDFQIALIMRDNLGWSHHFNEALTLMHSGESVSWSDVIERMICEYGEHAKDKAISRAQNFVRRCEVRG